MDPALKVYLDKLHAETKARTNDILRLLQDREALFSKFDTAVSTPQSARSMAAASDGGLTIDATIAAVHYNVSSSSAQAQEVLEVIHEASPDCIAMAPVTCLTDCSNQVVATDIVNEVRDIHEVRDATTAICPEAAIDPTDKEVELLTPAITTDVDPKSDVQEREGLTLAEATTDALSQGVFPVTSEAYHVVDSSDLAAPTLTTCSTKCSRRDTNPSRYALHPAVTPSSPTAIFDTFPAHAALLCNSMNNIKDTLAYVSSGEELQLEELQWQPWPPPLRVGVRLMRHMFRPRPWPWFNYHLDAGYPQVPCSVCCYELIPMEEPFICLPGTQLSSWRPTILATSDATQLSREEAIHWERVNYKGLQFSPCCLVQPLEGGEHFIHCETAYGFYLRMLQAVEIFRELISTVTTENYSSGSSVMYPGSVHERRVQYNAVKSKEFTSNIFLCFGIHLVGTILNLISLEPLATQSREHLPLLQPKPPWSVLTPTNFATEFRSNLRTNSESLHITGVLLELPQFWVATYDTSTSSFGIHLVGTLLILIELEQCTNTISYGKKPGLHPLCMSTSRALMVLLFEWPLFPCTEFLVRNLAAFPNSYTVNAPGNYSHQHPFVRFEKLWPTGTQEEILDYRWSAPLSKVFPQHSDPGDEHRYSEDISEYYGDLLVLLAYLTVEHIPSLQFWCSANSPPPIAQILNEPRVLECTNPVASDFIQRVSSCCCFSLATCALCVRDQPQVTFSTSVGALISPLAQQLHHSFGVESVFEPLLHILQHTCCPTFTPAYHKMDNSNSWLGEQHLSFPEPDADTCRREDIQAAIEGNQGLYSLCWDSSYDPNASVVNWVEYPADEVHESLNPESFTMTTSDLQPPKILMVLVISKRAPAMSGMTSFTCYNQDHFQEEKGVVVAAAVFVQGYVLDASLDWIFIHHNCYFYLVEVYSNFDYRGDSDHVQEHRVHWDPGGCQWCRLGVKPNFKKGGMLGASYILLGTWAAPFDQHMGWTRLCASPSASDYKYLGGSHEETIQWIMAWLGTAATFFPFLCSSL